MEMAFCGTYEQIIKIKVLNLHAMQMNIYGLK